MSCKTIDRRVEQVATSVPEAATAHMEKPMPAGAGACQAAPLPPPTGALHEMYYDDGTSYLGYVDEAQSACTEEDTHSQSSLDLEDDSDFDDRIAVNRAAQGSTSPARSTEKPVTTIVPAAWFSRRRNDVYSLRVLPDWAYAFHLPPVCPPAELPYEELNQFDEPVTEAAAHGDYGFTMQEEFPSAVEVAAADSSSSHHHNNLVQPQQPQQAVMCCYWKRGYCSMGNSCWYAHEGLASTPCHYGASCKKGHRHLVRSNKAAPVPRGGDAAAATSTNVNPAVAAAAGASGAAVPKRYVHEPKAPRASAPLLDSDMVCVQCGEAGHVRTQEFPLFEGDRVRQATRAHCGKCFRTFMLS